MKIHGLATTLSLAVVIGLNVWLSSSASGAAVVTNNPLACDTGVYTGGTTVTASPGDTFTLDFVDGGAGGCAGTTITYDTAALSAAVANGGSLTAGPLVFTVLAGATSGAHNMTLTTSVATPTTRSIAVTISGGASTSGRDAPPSWWKAYQRATKDTACNNGWNPSYAMWANSNSGGWVCVQELYYSGGTWLTR